MLRWFACMLFFLSPLTLDAQYQCDFTIQGNVIDEHDGSELGYANVVVVGQNQAAMSDEKGWYTLKAVCPGTLVLACSHVGCETVYDTLEVYANLEHNFYPEHHVELLEGISIEARSEEKESLSIMSTMYNLERALGSSLGESLTQITGVNTLNTGASIAKPMMHGLHSNRLLIMNNGIRQEGQQWGREHAPEIDPFIADELVVIKGASSVQYGPDAIAGVVLVNPKPLPDELGIGASLNLIGQSNGRAGNTDLALEGRAKKLPAFRWRVQGSLKKVGNQHAPDYYLKNTGYEEANFSGAASLVDKGRGVEFYYSQFNTKLGIFSAAHIGNLSDLQRAFESDRPLDSAGFSYNIVNPYQFVTHELIKAKGFINAGERGKLEIIYARQYNLRQEFDNGRGSDDVPALNFEITTQTLDAVWKVRPSNTFQYRLGTNTLAQGNTYTGRLFIPNFKKWNAGLFGVARKKFENNWAVELGARMDYIRLRVFIREGEDIVVYPHEFLQPSASLASSKQLSKSMKWTSNLATAWRPPTVNEWYSRGVHHGAATYEIGDTSLVQEVSYSWSNQLLLDIGRWNAEAEVYVNFMDGFINQQATFPATLTIRGAFPTFRYEQTDALLYGLDSRISYMLTEEVSVISQTSLLRARDLTKGGWIAQMPADQSRIELLYEPFHKNGDQNLYVSVNTQWVNKQWRVESNGDYVPPPEGFWLVGANAGIIIPREKSEIGIHLDVNNALNQRYRQYLNRFRYFGDELGRNFILRLTATF